MPRPAKRTPVATAHGRPRQRRHAAGVQTGASCPASSPSGKRPQSGSPVSKTPGKRRSAWRWLKRAAMVALGLALLYSGWIFTWVWYWTDHDPTTTAWMRARLQARREADPDATIEQRWVPYARISRHLKRAVVAAEDAKFLDHDGFDWQAIRQAYEKNLERGRIVAGGSTLSQQLAKNLFLSAARTPWRKAQEAAITVMIESLMSKRRILEIYLNVIEWGDGVFGAEAAARHYFGTSAVALSPRQAARLAAMVPNPRYYDRRGSTPHLENKTHIVLERMAAAQVP